MDYKERKIKDSIALLYSGGSDSTFSACLLAERFEKIYLMTYTRLGFWGKKMVFSHLERMRERFSRVMFIQRFINIDKLYKEICYNDYLNGIRKYGFMVLSTCGFCKIAMHWRNLIFCIDNNIKFTADGASMESREYVEQNPKILMPEIKSMYNYFGITHMNPVYQDGLSTEKGNYELGIVEEPKIKRTKFERQILCSQHILFAMFLRIYLSKHTFAEYEERMKEYARPKIDYIVELTKEYVEKGPDSRLYKLIEYGKNK